MKSTVVDESLSSFKPMYCSREYQASTRLGASYLLVTAKDKPAFVLYASSNFTYAVMETSGTVNLCKKYHAFIFTLKDPYI